MCFPKKAWIKCVSDGLGYRSNDGKYIGPHLNKVADILLKFENGSYLTSIFCDQFINLKNDYIHYGFLIVTDGNIQFI